MMVKLYVEVTLLEEIIRLLWRTGLYECSYMRKQHGIPLYI